MSRRRRKYLDQAEISHPASVHRYALRRRVCVCVFLVVLVANRYFPSQDRARTRRRLCLSLGDSVELEADLLQHETDLARCHARATPIVQVVLKVTVADAKLERLQKLLVVHEIQRVEHIEAQLQTETQNIGKSK